MKSMRLIAIAMICCLSYGISCKQKDPLSYAQILTGKVWQLDEIRYVHLNNSYYYKRGGTANNINYDDAIIEFKPDGTGFSRWQGNSYALTWQLDEANKKITYTLASGLTVVWDNVTFAESQLAYSEHYTSNGVVSLAYGVRTPQK